MDKAKLAICMKDLEYQARFVNCLLNHYKHLYEIHVFTNLEELKMTTPLTYSAMITGEYSTEEMTNFVEGGEKLLFLTEENYGDENSASETKIYTSKYQEVYKIEELIQRLIGDNLTAKVQNTKLSDCKWTGVYSLSKEKYQIPMAALLAEIYGEEEKVLLLDLQAYSGLMEMETDLSHMGLEDLLSVATTGNYSKGRIQECVGHESNWDYVYPLKNTECLIEGKKELYEIMMEILEREFRYERVIINFGTVFPGQMEMMEHCSSLFLLCGREAEGDWREEAFVSEMRRRGREDLLQKMKRVDVPGTSIASGTWRTLLEKWRWGPLGESMRQMIGREHKHGTAM